MTAEEYLAMDRAAEFRSEFLDGEIIAISGGSMRHSELGANLIGELRAALKNTQCRTFTSDFRVRFLVECTRVRQAHVRTWTIRDYLHAEDVLTIASIAVSLPVATIYERIEFPAE